MSTGKMKLVPLICQQPQQPQHEAAHGQRTDCAQHNTPQHSCTQQNRLRVPDGVYLSLQVATHRRNGLRGVVRARWPAASSSDTYVSPIETSHSFSIRSRRSICDRPLSTRNTFSRLPNVSSAMRLPFFFMKPAGWCRIMPRS
jgi:hypothetical protein